ncbi:hypothetical protein GCM10007320_08740 [Pseudorhodoferax aquiterrae]|uniref:Uncharacterized protein n=1 Tax=Pseudorhodoferax aquiterrae TaxID=747304 RepID=A0ABQ3FWI0_9BURK|nr:hypothetical protein [Pseudorhodoferax aquiterrae]GHC72695.1 hypothetical protein GCM10007320_08740 [Pseudorhodoferax aquiterrae]
MKGGRVFKLRIEVDVHGVSDQSVVAPDVNDALAELVNRLDFKSGSIPNGRAITHSHDFAARVVTVDVFHMVSEPSRHDQ